MTSYDRISTKIGDKNWQDSITHDDGTFSPDGGGKSTLHLSQPGKGKTTLMCYEAQMSRCMHVTKSDFVHDIIAKNDLSGYAGKIFQETVIWRARDMDSFANIIPQNWYTSFKGSLGSVKQLYLWVHENDTNVIFYCFNQKRQEMAVLNLPPPQFYTDAEDLIRRLHWGAINVVLEPQTYRLSPTLIQRLREKKMDISESEDRDQEYKKSQVERKDKTTRTRGRKHSRARMPTNYEKREVSSSYFWFELIHVARKMNKRRHIMFSLDEVDDIFEARSEGDVWKLIELLANDWKDLRKANISTSLSTHETDFIDWRIMHRIDYFIWMAGAGIHSKSILTVQALVSNLPMGAFLIEKRKIDFGINYFGKIPLAQPAVRIDGLKGEQLQLTEGTAKRLLRAYEESWTGRRVDDIIDIDNIGTKEGIIA